MKDNLKCPCGGDVIAMVLYQTSRDYYVKQNGGLYSRPFRVVGNEAMGLTAYVCESCSREESRPEDFKDEA